MRYLLQCGAGVTCLVAASEFKATMPRRSAMRPRFEVDSVQYMSARAASRMRVSLAALPIDMLGERPLFIAFTVPREWRRWVPDVTVWESMRRQMVKRWERRWGRLVGIWVREFQSTGAPHMHWYVPTPAGVSEREYQGLVRRTLIVRGLVEEFGAEGKGSTPTIGLQSRGRWASQDFGGGFAMWLRRAWSEIVTNGSHGMHYARGVDVRTSYWSDGAAKATDKRRVLAYMAGEMGKPSQKRVPYGFGSMTHFYGLFGRSLGFRPRFELVPVEEAVGLALADEIEQWVRHRIAKHNTPERAAEIFARRDRRQDHHGIEALGLFGEELDRLIARARERVELARVDVAGALDAPLP